MANNKNNKQQKGNSKKGTKKGVAGEVTRLKREVYALDKPARDFAKLLNDPCYAPIVPPVYSSSGTGIFMRVEADFIAGSEATSVGSACIFTPGLMGPTGSSVSGVLVPTTVVASDFGAIVWNNDLTKQPGFGMAASYGAVRVVAACLQVSYIGSELSRSGVVSLGQFTRAEAAAITTTAGLRSLSAKVVRVPDGVLEIKLAPTSMNEAFHSLSASGTTDAPDMASLACTVTGIANSTGVRYRLVQILEWMPSQGTGVINQTATTDSHSTLSAVVSALSRARPDWQFELLTGLGAYAAKAISWL
jgi:hypothetical protein